jgi:serine/threonine protein kinase
MTTRKFLRQEKIGSGSFGEIYRGECTATHEPVAIKCESRKCKCPQLAFESKIYERLKSSVSVPRLLHFETRPDYHMMVITLLDKSLEDLLAQQPEHRFSLKTVLMLADQMLTCIEAVHRRGYVHRDIKPDNFMMGLGNQSNQVFILDFGLCMRFRIFGTTTHIADSKNKPLTGTARYSSVPALQGHEQSRRDDMESLGYVWLYLLRGSLPWSGLHVKNSKLRYRKICDMKLRTTFEELCSGFPDEFVQYFSMVRQLKFPDEPAYSLYRNMFRRRMSELGLVYDYVYDWTGREITPPARPPVPACASDDEESEEEALLAVRQLMTAMDLRFPRHTGQPRDVARPGVRPPARRGSSVCHRPREVK